VAVGSAEALTPQATRLERFDGGSSQAHAALSTPYYTPVPIPRGGVFSTQGSDMPADPLASDLGHGGFDVIV